MICKYRDAENDMCSLHSDLSYPLLEYCVESPCPDEVLICNRNFISRYYRTLHQSGGTTMKLKKEHIAILNETAKIDFDSAMQMVDGVNMLSEVEYGFVHMNEDEYRLVYWEDGILKDAYKNCED
jgi:hypothetical protein